MECGKTNVNLQSLAQIEIDFEKVMLTQQKELMFSKRRFILTSLSFFISKFLCCRIVFVIFNLPLQCSVYLV